MLPFFVRHQAPLPPLMCQGQPRACMMCYFGCSCRSSAPALVLLLCTCYYYCAILPLFLLCLRYLFVANPLGNGYYASHPLSGMYVPPHLDVERWARLTRRRIRAIRTCTLCCCYLLLLLSLLHQRNRRRFALSFSSIDCCSTNCFVAICTHAKYTVRTPSVSYVTLCKQKCCLLLYERVIICCCAGYMCFQRFFHFTQASFLEYIQKQYCRTNSLELQPLRACAEAGVSPPRRSPLCTVYRYTHVRYKICDPHLFPLSDCRKTLLRLFECDYSTGPLVRK